MESSTDTEFIPSDEQASLHPDDKPSDNEVKADPTGNKSSPRKRSTSRLEKTRVSKKLKRTKSNQSLVDRDSRTEVVKHEYLSLYNTFISELATFSPLDDSTIESSQIGITTWTAPEKCLFFAALARKGRDDIAGISHTLGTKSEPEVLEYIQLLQNRLEYEALDQAKHTLAQYYEIPAAFEISPEVEAKLNAAADNLASKQANYEASRQEKLHGELWLLNEYSQNLLKERKATADANDVPWAEREKVDLAAELFNLPNWISLSSNLFMNSRIVEENWSYLAMPEQAPSMHLTAFLDFYDLAVMVTKRIVASISFLAMSRLKAMSSLKGKRKAEVNRRDVYSALDVLGLNKDVGEFWIGVARRSKVDVYASKGCFHDFVGGKLAADNAERALRSPSKRWHSMEMEKADVTPTNEQSSNDEESEFDDVPVLDTGFIYDYDNSSRPQSRKDRPPPLTLGQIEELHDNHANDNDMANSKVEERHLLSILGEATSDTPCSPVMQGPPPYMRKSEIDLADWRQTISYEPSWSRYKAPIQNSEFEAVGRRRSVNLAPVETIEVSDHGSNAPSDLDNTNDINDPGLSSSEPEKTDLSEADHSGPHSTLSEPDVELLHGYQQRQIGETTNGEIDEARHYEDVFDEEENGTTDEEQDELVVESSPPDNAIADHFEPLHPREKEDSVEEQEVTEEE